MRQKQKTKTADPGQDWKTRISALIGNLQFSTDTILKDAADQPLLFIEAGKLRVAAMTESLQKKLALEVTKNEISSQVRSELAKTDKRSTEAQIEQATITNPTYRQAAEQSIDAQCRDELARLVVEAYRQRRDCLKVVSDLVSSELSLQSAVSESRKKFDEARRKARKKYGDVF